MTAQRFVRALAVCGALMAGVSEAALGQSETEMATLSSWYDAVEPMKIVGPIHFVGTRGLAAYLITTPDGHILLNGAMPRSAPLIEESIRKLGFDPEDIEILLAGHAHVDHVGTHAYFERLSGAEVMMMGAEEQLLESGGEQDFHYAHLEPFRFEPVSVDHVLQDGETIELGGVRMTALLTPGHTQGSTTWVMDVTENDRTYRVVFPEGSAINPGYRIAKHPSYPGIGEAFQSTFRTLHGIEPDIWLASHTSFFDFENKRARSAHAGVVAWVDPEGYHQFLAERQRALEEWTLAEGMSPGFEDGHWRLVSFTATNGVTMSAKNRSKSVLAFSPDGSLSARIDCTHGIATWQLGGWSEIQMGELELSPAACPQHALTDLSDRLVQDWRNLQSYVFRDGRLLISSLGTNGGTYEFQPVRAAANGGDSR